MFQCFGWIKYYSFFSLNYFPSFVLPFFSNTICMLFTCYNYLKKDTFVSKNFKDFFSRQIAASFVNSKSRIQSWRGRKSKKNYGRKSSNTEVIEVGSEVSRQFVSIPRRTQKVRKLLLKQLFVYKKRYSCVKSPLLRPKYIFLVLSTVFFKYFC